MHSTQENSEQQRHLLVGGLLVLEVIPVRPAGLTTLRAEPTFGNTKWKFFKMTHRR